MFFGKKEKKAEEKEIEKNNSILAANKKTIKELIAPGGIDTSYTNHIEIISNTIRYARTMLVSTLPRTAVFPELLREMYMFGDSNTSVFIRPIPAGKSQTDLNNEITEITSEILVAANRGDVNRERTLSNKKAELEMLRDEIEAGYNNLFTASILTTLFAYSLEELDTLTENLSSAMGKTLLSIKPAWALQDTGFISNMPYNDNNINVYHNFDRSSMGTVFPFFTSEVGHSTGIPLGYNVQTGLPIIYDNFSTQLTNYNIIIFGTTGAGKSVTIKLLTARSYVLQGIETLALDVEGEYRVVAEALGGVNIEISPNSRTIINIFDIEPETRMDEVTGKEYEIVDLESKIGDVTQVLLTMAKGSTKSKDVTEVTKQIIAELVAQEYAGLGINSHPSTLYEGDFSVNSSEGFAKRRKKQMPTIGSWYRRLAGVSMNVENQDYKFHYSYLLKVMKQYIREYNGPLSYFDGQSTFNLEDGVPFINLDISNLEEKFARPLAQQILLSWVWEKFVKKNSEDRKKAAKKRVIIDEAWMLLKFEEAVDFLNAMARRARKRNVSLVLASQSFKDFYYNQDVRTILTLADTKLFLLQGTSEIDYLKETFKLSDGEANWLTTCTVGNGLLKIGDDTAILKIDPTQHELEFVDTNVNTIMMRKMKKDLE